MSAHDAACGHKHELLPDGTIVDRWTCGRLMAEKLVNLHDSRIRRCWFCGCQNYGVAPCVTCTAPAEKADLLREVG